MITKWYKFNSRQLYNFFFRGRNYDSKVINKPHYIILLRLIKIKIKYTSIISKRMRRRYGLQIFVSIF